MENIWNAILNLKEAVKAFDLPIHACWLQEDTGIVHINQPPTNFNPSLLILCGSNATIEDTAITTFRLMEVGNVQLIHQGDMGSQKILFLKKYLSYCFLSLQAKKRRRAISITHFAQTLDAKIATNTGDSKWIGNSENLTHAHRMRAICDGVLVGSRTVEADHPKLNVRHVSGKNPVRIVLGNPKSDFKSLLTCAKEKILVFGKEKLEVKAPLESIVLPTICPQKHIAPRAILMELYRQDIHSVYIEGGATTTSAFIQAEAVDVLQLHIAPIIFGSGKSAITLPTIDQVQEAINFKAYNFLPFGDSMMFTGYLQDNGIIQE